MDKIEFSKLKDKEDMIIAFNQLKDDYSLLFKELEEYQKELEKADSITQSCIFNGKKESEISYRKALNLLEELDQENQELKKQLEEVEFIVTLSKKRNLINEFNKEYDEEDKKNNPNRNYAEIVPDAEEIYKRYYAMKTQQKEFIEWLEKNINHYKEIIKSDRENNTEQDCRRFETRWSTYEEALSKYKSIIGSDKSE